MIKYLYNSYTFKMLSTNLKNITTLIKYRDDELENIT